MMSDQSLREALETLAEEWRYRSEDLTPWQEGGGPSPDEAAFDDAAAKLRDLLAAHPAEPAPEVATIVPDQGDVDAVRDLLDLMEEFESNDQRARYLLSSNWLRDRAAAASSRLTPVGVEITDERVEAVAEAYWESDYTPGMIRPAEKWTDLVELDPYMVEVYRRNTRAILVAARPFMTSRPALDREAAIERAARAIHRWDKRPIVWEQLDSETITQYRSEAAVVVDAVMAPAVPVPTREQIERTLRDRLVRSNFNDHLHEPVRTQTIDTWVDVLAGAMLALLNGSAKPTER